MTAFNVGGAEVGCVQRWEYVITGNPITQVGNAEKEAAAGEIVLVILIL